MVVTFGAAHLANVFHPHMAAALLAWFNGALLQLLFELLTYSECSTRCVFILQFSTLRVLLVA